MKEQYKLLREKFSHTKEEFIKKSKLVHGEKYNYSLVNYVNAKTPVDIICPYHGIFKQTPDKHTHGQGCPKCSKNYKPTLKEFIDKCRRVFGDKYDYSHTEYVNKDTPINVVCCKCGEHFTVTPHNHIIHKEGCPHCRQSKMEMTIENSLKERDIVFERQKVFDWLVSGKSVKRLDFYLPDYEIVIECQGLQHFKPIEYFGGDAYFERQQKNDKIKKKLCELHGINVIYYSDIKTNFPYDVITNISDLMEKLNKAANRGN